jgi:hypothetical protein
MLRSLNDNLLVGRKYKIELNEQRNMKIFND